MLPGIPLFPEQASTIAPAVDNLYFFILGVTAFFALLVVVLVLYFAIKYRDDTGLKVGAPITGSIPLEIGWSLVPFFVAMAIFVWSTVVFFQIVGRIRRGVRVSHRHPRSRGWFRHQTRVD